MAGDGFFKTGEPILPPSPTATRSSSSSLPLLPGLPPAAGEGPEMEMRSSFLQRASGACGPGKLSFQEESSGAGDGGSSFKSAAAAAAAPLRKGKGVAPPPRCLVEGCGVDLTGAKAYYCRHKVCGMHSKAPRVIVAGMEQRFCQQCSRFHQLQEFDQGKRSCRRRLACHNERRRKPLPRPLLSQIGHLSSAFHGDNRFRGFLVDFTHPKMPALVQDARQIGQAGSHGGYGAPASRVVNHGAHAYTEDPMCGTTLPASGTLTFAGGCSDSSCALSLLSTQPWDRSSRVNHQPTSSARCSFEGTPIAGHNTSWGSKGLQGSSSSTSFEVRSTELGEPANHLFSGELELALLGKRQCMSLDHSRRYQHSDDDGIGWSL